jgi:hypothetical protein
VATTARTVAAAAAPLLAGVLLSVGLLSAPFLIAGGMKIGYDLALLCAFRAVKPPEEETAISLKRGTHDAVDHP